MVKIVIEIDDNLMKEIREIAKAESTDEKTLVLKLIREGVNRWKLKQALELYKLGKVFIWRAARIAGLSLWEFIEELKRREIELNLDFSDIEEF